MQLQRAGRELGVVHHRHRRGRLRHQRAGVDVDIAGAQRLGAVGAQHAARDLRAAAEGIRAGQGQRAAAQLGQLAGAADVVAPRVQGLEAAPGRVHRDADVAIEGAVAVRRGEQVQPAPALGIVHDRRAGRQRGRLQHHAALVGAEVGQARLQQHLRALGHDRRLGGGGDRRQAEGHQAQHRRLVGGVVGVGVLRQRQRMRIGLQRRGVLRADGGHQGRARLVVGGLAAGLVGIGGQVGRRGRHALDATADHVQRRMHARVDAVLAQHQGAGDHLLVALGHEVGHRQRLAHGFRAVAADEAAIGRRRAALGRLQRRHHLDAGAPAPGAGVLVEALGRLRRRVVADVGHQVDRRAEAVAVGAARVADVVALVVVEHRGRVGRDVRDGGALLAERAPGRRQRAHAVADAVALAAAIVEVGGQLLRRGAARGGIDDVLHVGGMDRRVEHLAVGRVAGQAAPVRSRHGREAVARRGARARVDEQRARLPDVQEARHHAHAGVGLQRGVARVAALVARDVVDEGRDLRLVLHRGAVGRAQALGRGGDDQGLVLAVVVVGGAGAEQQRGHEHGEQGEQQRAALGREGGERHRW